MGDKFRRSAPILGRSKPGNFQISIKYVHENHPGVCCAKGRARSGGLAFLTIVL